MRPGDRTYMVRGTLCGDLLPALNVYPLVPSASDRMLQKSLTTPSDVIIYDLEDSVPPSEADKNRARDNLTNFLVGFITKVLRSNVLIRL